MTQSRVEMHQKNTKNRPKVVFRHVLQKNLGPPLKNAFCLLGDLKTSIFVNFNRKCSKFAWFIIRLNSSFGNRSQ